MKNYFRILKNHLILLFGGVLYNKRGGVFCKVHGNRMFSSNKHRVGTYCLDDKGWVIYTGTLDINRIRWHYIGDILW